MTHTPSTRTAAALGAFALLAGLGTAAAGTDVAQTAQTADVQLAATTVAQPTIVAGTPFSFDLDDVAAQLAAQAGYPGAKITIDSITGLPAGVSWDKNTNVVSGTVAEPGTYQLTVSGRGCLGLFCQSVSGQQVPIVVSPVGTPITDPAPSTPGTGTTPGTGAVPAGSLGSTGGTGSLGS